LKISLEVRITDKDEVSIKCNYNQASSTLLFQSIAYMLDTAYNGDNELITTVAEQIPDIVKEYCRLKDLQDDTNNAEQNLQNVIESFSIEDIENMSKRELEKDPKDRDMDYFMKLLSELMKREVKSGRTTSETKA